MKITIEGKPKEIAALVLEIQERRERSVSLLNTSNFDTDNLVREEHDIAELTRVAIQGQNTRIR